MEGVSCQINELRGKIEKLIVWRSGTNRAPHKPLQLLMAVANAQNCKPRLQPFAEIEPKLRTALETFGPVRKAVHPEYPFWHLQTDKIWEVVSDGEVIVPAPHDDFGSRVAAQCDNPLVFFQPPPLLVVQRFYCLDIKVIARHGIH